MLLLFDFKVTFYSAKVLTLLNTANKMSNNDKVLSCLIKINKGNLGQNKDNLMNLLMKDCHCSKKYFIGFNRKRGSSQYIKNEYYRIAYKVEINVILRDTFRAKLATLSKNDSIIRVFLWIL